MPAFRLTNGHPVYCAAWKRHLSLHDIPTLSEPIETTLEQYRSGKDTLKFAYCNPIPYDLIETIVRHVAQRQLDT